PRRSSLGSAPLHLGSSQAIHYCETLSTASSSCRACVWRRVRRNKPDLTAGRKLAGVDPRPSEQPGNGASDPGTVAEPVAIFPSPNDQATRRDARAVRGEFLTPATAPVSGGQCSGVLARAEWSGRYSE